MLTITWTNTADFTAVSGCSVADGTVTMSPFDHADIPNSYLAAAWSLNESSGNAVDAVASNNLTPTNVTRASAMSGNGATLSGNGYLTGPNNMFSTATKGAISVWFKIGASVTGDQTIWTITDTAAGAGTQTTVALRLTWNAGSSKFTTTIFYSNVGTATTEVASGSTLISRNVWNHIVVSSSGSAWTCAINGSNESLSGTNKGRWIDDVNGTKVVTFGAERVLSAYTRYVTGQLDEITWWSEAASTAQAAAIYNSGSGRFHYRHTAIVSIHDAGVAYADAGAIGYCFDYSTSTKTTSGNDSISGVDVYSSDISGDTPSYETDASWAAHLLRSSDNHRYLWRRLQFTSSDALQVTISEVTTDSNPCDVPVGPPSDPSATAYAAVAETNYAINWDQPEEADFSHCEMKRTTDGETMEYLTFTGGAPLWQSGDFEDPFFKFTENEYASGYMPDSAYIDETVTGTSIAYWVRARDFYGNSTSWVACSLYVGDADFPDVGNVLDDDTVNGEAGTFTNVSEDDVRAGISWGDDGTEFTGTLSVDIAVAPTLTLTSGDGSITATLTPADGEVSPMYVRYKTGAGDISDESEDLKRTGAGDIEITGLENGSAYLVFAYHKGASVGDWAVASAVPLSSSLDPANSISMQLYYLREMLGDCAAWQAWTNTESAAAAKLKIFYEAVPAGSTWQSDTDFSTRLSSLRPFMVIGIDKVWNYSRVATGTRHYMNVSGSAIMAFDATVPTAYSGDNKLDSAMLWFDNMVGGVIDDLCQLSGKSGRLSITDIVQLDPPGRVQVDGAQTGGDVMTAVYQVKWGL